MRLKQKPSYQGWTKQYNRKSNEPQETGEGVGFSNREVKEGRNKCSVYIIHMCDIIKEQI